MSHLNTFIQCPGKIPVEYLNLNRVNSSYSFGDILGSKKAKLKEEEAKKEETQKKEEKKRHDVRRDIPSQIIRVAGTDLDGGKPLIRALRKIKGLGFITTSEICRIAKIDPYTKLGELNESQMTSLEGIIKNPTKYGMVDYLINRRRDPDTGGNVHLTASDLDVAKKFDIQKYINLKTYRGWRHMQGQPVRGQRTRSTFRNKGRTVGVIKKAVLGAAPKAAETKPAAPAKK